MNVFTSNIHAEMIPAYEGFPDTTEGWTKTKDVANYKVVDRIRLEKGGKPNRRARGSQAEHASYSDAIESYRVYEFAEKFTLDRQDLLDDEFNALEAFSPTEMAEAFAELRMDFAYSILLSNPEMRDGLPLFDAAHRNVPNSASALGIQALQRSRTRMFVQQENDRNLNLKPKYLIVSGLLQPEAENLIKENVIVTGEGLTAPARNSNASARLSLVADPRLDNGVVDPVTTELHASDPNQWFLAAAKPMIEIGYIRALGRTPQLRSWVESKGMFGIGFDASLSIGAKAIDWRGLNRETP